MSHDTSLAGNHLLDLSVSVLAAEACVSHLHGGQTAGALGTERALTEESVVYVHYPAAAVGSYGDSAAEMSDDEVEVSIGTAGLAGIELGDGLVVQRVENRNLREERMTADAGYVRELVHHDGIGDEGPAALCRSCNPLGQDTAEVAGMLAVAGRGQVRGHSVIDFIYTGGYGTEQTAAAYDDRDV